MNRDKNVLILGTDGYIGWALSVELRTLGYNVFGIDNESRRSLVKEVDGQSAIPIANVKERQKFSQVLYRNLTHWNVRYDLKEKNLPEHLDAIVHLAEQPSAPYSMRSASHAIFSQENNVLGTLKILWEMQEKFSEAHLIKLGTMGEYGTPNIPIPEGVFTDGSICHDRENKPYDLSGKMFPRQAGSFYHLSKVHDTFNVKFACDNWGLRATDIMQGVVYGTRTNVTDDNDSSVLKTRFDFDECFGTVINRFCAQATIGMPLTVYGRGDQIRGFLPLRDVMQCLLIAIDQPPESGTYRVWNQFDKTYSINDLATYVKSVGDSIGLNVKIENVENPRKEKEAHTYKVDTSTLRSLGYQPSADLQGEILKILMDLRDNKPRIESAAKSILPQTKWVGNL